MKISQIKKKLQNELKSAITEVKSKSDQIVEESFAQFYGGGSPVLYQRTGGLKASKIDSPVSFSGNSASVRVGYDPNQVPNHAGPNVMYGTVLSKSLYHSGYEVFMNSEEGQYGAMHPVVGASGFASEGVIKIMLAVDEIFAKHFS